MIARFNGDMLSSDSGVLARAEVDPRLRVADRLVRYIDDPRSLEQVVHSLVDMIGFDRLTFESMTTLQSWK